MTLDFFLVFILPPLSLLVIGWTAVFLHERASRRELQAQAAGKQPGLHR